MKFLCDNCKSKYQIADEKIAGRTLRMKCRRCDHDIIIRGESLAPRSAPRQTSVERPERPRTGSQVGPAPRRLGRPDSRVGMPAAKPQARHAASPLGADFRRQMGDNRASVASSPPPAMPPDQWHVAINDVPVGPIKREEVGRKIAAGAVGPESLAWREGFDDWRPVRDIPELSSLLRPRRATPPPAVPRPPPGAARAPARGPAPQPPRGGAPRSAPPPGPQQAPGRQVARSNVIPIAGRLGAAALPSYDAPVDEENTMISDGIPPGVPAEELMPLPEDRATDAIAPAMFADVQRPMPAMHAPLAPQQPMYPPVGATPMPMAVHPIPTAVPSYGTIVVPQRRGLPIGAWIAIVGAASFGVALAVMVATKLLSEPDQTVAMPLPSVPVAPEEATPNIHVTAPDEAPPPVEPPPAEEAPGEETGPARPDGPRVSKTPRSGSADPPVATTMEQQAVMVEDEELPGNIRVPTGESGAGPVASRGQGLNEQQLRTVVGNNQGAVRRCYEQTIRGMADPPSMRINVAITVGASGVVTSVRANGSSLAGMNQCIESAVRRWRFPASTDATRTSVPFVFQPSTGR